ERDGGRGADRQGLRGGRGRVRRRRDRRARGVVDLRRGRCGRRGSRAAGAAACPQDRRHRVAAGAGQWFLPAGVRRGTGVASAGAGRAADQVRQARTVHPAADGHRRVPAGGRRAGDVVAPVRPVARRGEVMIIAFALAAAVLFGSGAYLLLKRDLVRMVAGIMLISQAAVLTIIASSLNRGQAVIHVGPDDDPSDPLPQALALTALVIGLATVALLLAMVHRVVVVFRTSEQDALAATEAEVEARLERKRQADREEVEGVEGAKEDDAEAIEHEELGRVR